MASASSVIVPAATLVAVREHDGIPELLMLERSRDMRFAAGALVFPGGAVDPNDAALATRFAGDPDDMTSRIAAIRETIEETGIAVGVVPAPDADTIAHMRLKLAEGADFGALLDEAGLVLDLDALHLFARWQPPLNIGVKRFDTRFYVAIAPDNSVEAVDGTENVHAFWATADTVIRDAEAGQHFLIFPTRANLIRLAQFGNFDAIREDAARFGHHLTISELSKDEDGIAWTRIADNTGYSHTQEPHKP